MVEKDRKGGVYLTREVSEDPDGCRCVFTSPRWDWEGWAIVGVVRAGSQWVVVRVWQIKKPLPSICCLWWGVDG